jgi:hypothetical protein
MSEKKSNIFIKYTVPKGENDSSLMVQAPPHLAPNLPEQKKS